MLLDSSFPSVENGLSRKRGDAPSSLSVLGRNARVGHFRRALCLLRKLTMTGIAAVPGLW